MKKLSSIPLVLALLSAGAMAQQQPQAAQQQRETPGQQQIADIYSFCYVENRAYSEGFQLNDLVCARSTSGPTKVLSRDGYTTQVQPLVWKQKPGFYKQ